MRRLHHCVVAMSFFSAPAFAEDWTCHNKDTEIACDAKACKVSPPGDFTPTELNVNTNGAISYCAYSGCWNGQASGTLKVGDFFTAVGLQLPWSGPMSKPGNISATINTKTRIAVVLAQGFAHPMTCKAR